MKRKLMWYALSKINGLEIRHIDMILQYSGDIELLFCRNKDKVKRLFDELRFHNKLTQQLLKLTETDYSDELENLSKNGIFFVTKEDSGYPKRLQNMQQAPYYLYYKGRLPSGSVPSLAVIGARNCSIYGKEIALCFSSILAESGIQIISGMARGIDGYAHKGALEVGGYTCGVLGFGIDICYPKEHNGLKHDLQDKGGVITEYPLGTPGLQQNFPARNRLIAGLSDAVLVIEAAHKSGTLITVDFALEQGKMVYAIPGRIGDSLSEGCNDIIKDGGKIVTEPQDIFEEFRMKLVQKHENSENQKNKIVLETQEKMLYACLDLEPRLLEQLILATKLSRNDVLLSLMRLERAGYIRQPMKNYFIRNIR